jgi:hypothetical protein
MSDNGTLRSEPLGFGLIAGGLAVGGVMVTFGAVIVWNKSPATWLAVSGVAAKLLDRR